MQGMQVGCERLRWNLCESREPLPGASNVERKAKGPAGSAEPFLEHAHGGDGNNNLAPRPPVGQQPMYETIGERIVRETLRNVASQIERTIQPDSRDPIHWGSVAETLLEIASRHLPVEGQSGKSTAVEVYGAANSLLEFQSEDPQVRRACYQLSAILRCSIEIARAVQRGAT